MSEQSGRKKAPTLLDVAARAGVSRATASLVLRDTGRVSEATRARVREAMAEMGYVHDRAAAALRTRTTRTVGVLVTHLGNPFHAELLGGLQEALRVEGYACILATSGDDLQQQRQALRELRSHAVSAIAVVPATASGPDVEGELRELGMPFVMMTRHTGGASLPYVGPDDVCGGRLAAEHLIGHGARTLAYLGGSSDVRARAERRRGVCDALEAAGLDAAQLLDVPGENSGRGGLRAMERLIDAHGLPDAVVCHSDSVAFGACRALRLRGRAGSVRVTGYDDIAAAEIWEPPLTSVATFPAELGGRAARHLLDQIENGTDAGFVRISPVLRVRESCGCPGAGGG